MLLIQADGKASTTISCREVLLALVLTPTLTNVNSREEEEDEEEERKIVPKTMKGPLIQAVYLADTKPTDGTTMRGPRQQLPPWLQSDHTLPTPARLCCVDTRESHHLHLLFPNQFPSKGSWGTISVLMSLTRNHPRGW